VGHANALLERAATRLEELGPVVVAAAGNEGSREPRYPAAYPTVIGVGSFDPRRRISARSNLGPSAQILAPGAEILTTVPGDSFSFVDGTSLAAAHVSGVLALLTAAGGDARIARAELFGVGREADPAGPGTLLMPPVCEVLASLGKPCPGVVHSPGLSGASRESPPEP
jgi:subtilisin family serine protease